MAALGVAGLLAAGCTDSSSGTPRPQDGTSLPKTTAPDRPRAVRLDGKDPCALIPQEDRARFYIERPGVADESKVFKSPQCLYSTDVGGFNIALVVTEGIEKWIDGSKSVKAEETRPVTGFPAISATSPVDPQACNVAVDVADGQYVLATVFVTRGKESQVPERCEYAHQLAESAMKTLVGS